jgi:hypothetical protein
MKFAFTSFDKAIVAAVLAPLAALVTTWANGGTLDEKSGIVAVVAGLIAGLVVYLKGNAPASSKPVVAAVPPPA